MKSLLVAIALMSLSSVSYASTVSASSIAGSAGSISLTTDGDIVTVGALFDDTGSAFYDVTLEDTGLLTSIGLSLDVYPFAIYDIDFSIYSAYDSVAETFSGLLASGTNYVNSVLSGGPTYYLLLEGVSGSSYNVDISAVPVPAAGIMFATALLGVGVFGRRKKKSNKKTLMVGAFTRAS